MIHEKYTLLLYRSAVSTKSRKRDGLLLKYCRLLCDLITLEEQGIKKFMTDQE